MPYDFRSKRLFVRADLGGGAEIETEPAQVNYLLYVLRLRSGDAILLFNGRDGEWRARLVAPTRKAAALIVESQTREQTTPPDLHYLFAPLKNARLDYVVEKAVEMGVGRLRPVFTRRTQAHRVNLKRMQANAIEAAEQCGILSVPAIEAPLPLGEVLDGWEAGRRLIFCDEGAPTASPPEAMRRVEQGPAALLIGPEGGFCDEERADLLARPFVTALSLGPRILRADTAAVAALALVQTFIGDWR